MRTAYISNRKKAWSTVCPKYKMRKFTNSHNSIHFSANLRIQFDILKFGKKNQNDECRVSRVGPSVPVKG